MPNKYPGGYRIIDLKGINIPIDGTQVPTDEDYYALICQSPKPVVITNFDNEYIELGGKKINYLPLLGTTLDSDSNPALMFGFSQVKRDTGEVLCLQGIIISREKLIEYYEN